MQILRKYRPLISFGNKKVITKKHKSMPNPKTLQHTIISQNIYNQNVKNLNGKQKLYEKCVILSQDEIDAVNVILHFTLIH